MVVASQTWELSLHGCASLKQKRSVIRSLRDRLRSKFNVSVAETGLQDVHARAEISIALETGDLLYASIAVQVYCVRAFLIGTNLLDLEEVMTAYMYLDTTPKGRNETTIMDWIRRHDEYPAS